MTALDEAGESSQRISPPEESLVRAKETWTAGKQYSWEVVFVL